MYVRKFEGDSLDEALKKVKVELGPDAIILKTVTNKGLKGAFKKSRIEITAAISEQSYVKKAKVDHVLTNEQKNDFYKAPASSINHMINDYDHHAPTQPNKTGYGSLGLNKVVNTVTQTSNKIKNSLDDFLSEDIKTPSNRENSHQVSTPIKMDRLSPSDFAIDPVESMTSKSSLETEVLEGQVNKQKIQLEVLEKKIFELTEKLSQKNTRQVEPKGIQFAKNTLKALDISDKLVSEIVKKIQFELSNDDIQDIDIVYDFILKEMNSFIRVELPLASRVANDKKVITVLISENSSGQSSIANKMAILQEDSKIIRFRQDSQFDDVSLAKDLYKLKTANASNLSELMSELRKAYAENKNTIIDLRLSFKDSNESKKFIETLLRSYKDIEFILNLSAIHAENYNRKILAKYHNFIGGVNINYIDQCMSFGSILNLHKEYNHVPLKYFGTGPTAPDDIESASAERILAEMFDL